ncbi:MAG TPA: hypothetical protein VFA34_05365 [Actinomycetota bacterium]|nr:hypothetical protein [Actinomycetota bacterium]
MPGPFACVVAGALVLGSLGACSSEPQAAACPGQYNPSKLSDRALRRENIGKLPERGATTQSHVERTLAQRHGWIEANYPGVVDVKVDDGWGVTYTRDQYGDITFHHAPDFLIETTVAKRRDCPDPERGTLLIFGPEGLRVPVRFVYQPA